MFIFPLLSQLMPTSTNPIKSIFSLSMTANEWNFALVFLFKSAGYKIEDDDQYHRAGCGSQNLYKIGYICFEIYKSEEHFAQPTAHNPKNNSNEKSIAPARHYELGKVTRNSAANLMIYKPSIKYMYKEGENGK